MADVAYAAPVPAPPTKRSAVPGIALALGLGLAAFAAAVPLSSHLYVFRGWLAADAAEQVIVPILVGLYWSRRRAGSRFGPMLVAYGLLAVGVALQSAASEVPHTVGVLWNGLFFVATVAVILAFPSGRLLRTVDRAIVTAAGVLVVLFEVPYALFSYRLDGANPLASCRPAACPDNAFFVGPHPQLTAFLVPTMNYAAAALSFAVAAVVAHRFVRASRPRRRSLAFGDAAGFVFLVVFAADRLALNAGFADGFSRWVLVAALGLLAWGFLGALLQAEIFAGRVLRETVERSLGHPTVAEVERSLRAVLDDPDARLGFRARWGGFVDVEGNDLELPLPGSDRRMQRIARAGGSPAVLVYDAELDDEPELLLAAGAALLGCENTLLEDEIENVMHSRARVFEAGHLERRRLERDLHDGVQQQLVALRIKLGLTRDLENENPKLRARLDDVRREIDETILAIRELARDIYPPLLADEGLAVALRAAAARSPQRVRVDCTFADAHPVSVRGAVYFCCVEALRNAAAHAGPDAVVELDIRDFDDEIWVTVRDDGCGFDPGETRERSGIAGMRDRLGALGGTLVVRSAPGMGTVVVGSIPTGQTTRGFSAADSARKTRVAATRRFTSVSSGSSSLEKIDPM
jgi:signal transduction histidine kinase